MKIELDASEDAAANLRRIVAERASAAIEELSDPPPGGEARRIHAARKRFKEIRAALRLARGALGDSLFREENRAYRDAARPLSAVRDAQVWTETLDALLEHFGDELDPSAFRPFRATLQKRARICRRKVVVEEEAMPRVREESIAARGRVARWKLDGSDFDDFVDGIVDTYRRGRKAMRRALREGGDEALHEWRKQVKYLRHEAEILRPLWPAGMKAMIREGKDLGDLLGDDHDLAVLDGLLETELRDQVARRERQTIRGLIAKRRPKLQGKAESSARRLFAEKPKAFRRRLASYLDEWRRP